MKILSNKEIENKEYLSQEEEICAYSVETESSSFDDDQFNGTLSECQEYCKNYIDTGAKYQIALVTLNTDGCVTFCHNLIRYNMD